MAFTRNIGNKIFNNYSTQSFSRVFNFLEKNNKAEFLDLGCGAGDLTLTVAKKIGTKKIYGLETVKKDVVEAGKKGIKSKVADLNEKFPYKNNSFDAILAHYSIEHLVNVAGFVSEIKRVLKPGGYVVVASDNLNSWLNIVAMILTYQPFSITRGLSYKTVGNPFAYWTDNEVDDFMLREKGSPIGAGSHIKVMSSRAAREIFNNEGFSNVKISGAGYFPLFGLLSEKFADLDVYHSHFWILKARKDK